MAAQEALSNAAALTQDQLSTLFKPPYTYDAAKKSTGSAENAPIDNLQDHEFIDNSLDDDRFFEGTCHQPRCSSLYLTSFVSCRARIRRLRRQAPKHPWRRDTRQRPRHLERKGFRWQLGNLLP